jgi:hypothetical protein
MNKILTSVFTCILFTSILNVNAQVRNVSYDFTKNTFDNDYNIPSEERFTMTGFIDSTIQLVELDIYEGVNKKGEKKEYYNTSWQKDKSDNGNQFYLSVKQPLRQNSKYDFDLRFFRILNSEEVDYTETSLVSSIYNYLSAIAINEGKSLELNESPEVIQTEINRIVKEGLTKYRTRTQEQFPGFSDIIVRQLDELSEITGKRARQIKKDENNSIEGEYTNKIAAIVQQVQIELDQYFNNDVLVLSETKTVKDHPTEKQRNIVAINGGYGGAWFSGNLNDFNYGHAPYVGLSFPLGKKAFTSKFWSNTSISMGVFVLNFKDKDDVAIKGPIIQRPFYVALGYKFFRFLRFNAGAVVLEKESVNDQFVNTDKIFIRPFVGLSLELNFWADFAK